MILDRVKRSLKNNSGSGLIWGIVIVLILLMLFASVSEYLRNHIILNGARNAIESVATNIATENYNEIYPNARKGYFGAYQISNTDKWEEKIDKSNIDKELKNILGVQKEDNKYVKRFKNSGDIEYTLSNLNFKIDNPTLAPISDKNKNKFTVEISADIELNRMFNIFDNKDKVKTRIGAKVGYIPKY